MSKSTLRGAFTQTLLEIAKTNQNICALATDSRGSVTLGDFAKELPGQFVECGIAEQDAVGIGAGLANAGLRPFVCGPACFFSMRSAEQVKVDVAYSHMNVKIIGVSGCDSRRAGRGDRPAGLCGDRRRAGGAEPPVDQVSGRHQPEGYRRDAERERDGGGR